MTQRARMDRSLEREAAIHMHLRHENIVSMIGVVFDLDNQGIVLEYVKYGALASFAKRISDGQGLRQ